MDKATQNTGQVYPCDTVRFSNQDPTGRSRTSKGVLAFQGSSTRKLSPGLLRSSAAARTIHTDTKNKAIPQRQSGPLGEPTAFVTAYCAATDRRVRKTSTPRQQQSVLHYDTNYRQSTTLLRTYTSYYTYACVCVQRQRHKEHAQYANKNGFTHQVTATATVYHRAGAPRSKYPQENKKHQRAHQPELVSISATAVDEFPTKSAANVYQYFK